MVWQLTPSLPYSVVTLMDEVITMTEGISGNLAVPLRFSGPRGRVFPSVHTLSRTTKFPRFDNRMVIFTELKLRAKQYKWNRPQPNIQFTLSRDYVATQYIIWSETLCYVYLNILVCKMVNIQSVNDKSAFNPLAPGKFGNDIIGVVSKCMLRIQFMRNSYEIFLSGIPQITFDDKSTLLRRLPMG